MKGAESHWHKLGFRSVGCQKSGRSSSLGATECRFASETKDIRGATSSADVIARRNTLTWAEDDSTGLVVGADYGFFRLEVEGNYSDGNAKSWRGHTATNGKVHQARIFANIVVEPFDLLELLGEFGGVDPLVRYNPAHYGISPYAMYGYGVMGGIVENLDYTHVGSDTYNTGGSEATTVGAFGGGATAAVNVGAGVNIGLDTLARKFSEASGSTLPEYFKLPIEFSVGYHWQVGLDELLFDSVDEDLGIQDGGITYSVGLKW